MKKEIYLAGGCFWGLEAYYKTIDGILDTEVGYANGRKEDTNYQIVNITDHAETVHIVYDDGIIELKKILEYFYYIIDPFSINKQGNDRGRQYRSGVYTINSEQLKEATGFFSEKQKNADQKIQVEVEMLKNYVLAEEYHQDYLDKNPQGYCHINLNDKPKL